LELVPRLLAQGPSEPLDDLADALVTGLDAHAPELAGTITITIGDIHADIGDLGRARQWAARARQAPLPLPGDAVNRQDLVGRCRIAEGAVDEGVQLARDAIAALKENGAGRNADVQLARIARSLRAVGENARAAEIRAQSARGLTGPRSIWEAVLL